MTYDCEKPKQCEKRDKSSCPKRNKRSRSGKRESCPCGCEGKHPRRSIEKKPAKRCMCFICQSNGSCLCDHHNKVDQKKDKCSRRDNSRVDKKCEEKNNKEDKDDCDDVIVIFKSQDESHSRGKNEPRKQHIDHSESSSSGQQDKSREDDHCTCGKKEDQYPSEDNCPSQEKPSSCRSNEDDANDVDGDKKISFCLLLNEDRQKHEEEGCAKTLKCTCEKCESKRAPCAKDPSARNPCARDPSARDLCAKDRSARDPSAREPCAKDRSARDSSAREPCAKDRSARDSSAREPCAKDRSARDSSAREPCAKDRSARDSSAREPCAKDRSARDPCTRDPCARDASARDPCARDASARDPCARDASARDPCASARDLCAGIDEDKPIKKCDKPSGKQPKCSCNKFKHSEDKSDRQSCGKTERHSGLGNTRESSCNKREKAVCHTRKSSYDKRRTSCDRSIESATEKRSKYVVCEKRSNSQQDGMRNPGCGTRKESEYKHAKPGCDKKVSDSVKYKENTKNKCAKEVEKTLVHLEKELEKYPCTAKLLRDLYEEFEKDKSTSKDGYCDDCSSKKKEKKERKQKAPPCSRSVCSLRSKGSKASNCEKPSRNKENIWHCHTSSSPSGSNPAGCEKRKVDENCPLHGAKTRSFFNCMMEHLKFFKCDDSQQ